MEEELKARARGESEALTDLLRYAAERYVLVCGELSVLRAKQKKEDVEPGSPPRA